MPLMNFHSSENFDIRLGFGESYTIFSNGPFEVKAKCSRRSEVSLQVIINNDARTRIKVFGFIPTINSIPTSFVENIQPGNQVSKLFWNSADDTSIVSTSSGYYVRVSGSVVGFDRNSQSPVLLFGPNIDCVVTGEIWYGSNIPIYDITREPSSEPSTSPPV